MYLLVFAFVTLQSNPVDPDKPQQNRLQVYAISDPITPDPLHQFDSASTLPLSMYTYLPHLYIASEAVHPIALLSCFALFVLPLCFHVRMLPCLCSLLERPSPPVSYSCGALQTALCRFMAVKTRPNPRPCRASSRKLGHVPLSLRHAVRVLSPPLDSISSFSSISSLSATRLSSGGLLLRLGARVLDVECCV